MTAPRLSLIVLRCANLQRSREFYEAALGVEFAPERHGGVDHLAVRLDGGDRDGAVSAGPGAGEPGPTRVRGCSSVRRAGPDARRWFQSTDDGQHGADHRPGRQRGRGAAGRQRAAIHAGRYTLEEACSRLGLDPGRVRERASQLRAEADAIPVVGQ